MVDKADIRQLSNGLRDRSARGLDLAGAADWPSPEVVVEASQYRGGLLLEFLKRFYEGRSILERYDSGEITLHVHGRIGDGWYCATFRRCITSDHGFYFGIDCNKILMFIGIRKFAKSPCPTTTRKGLQLLERCLVPIGKEGKPALPTPAGLPAIWMIFNREFRSLLDLSAIKISELKNEIIQGGAEVVDYLSNKDGHTLRDRIAGHLKSTRRCGGDGYHSFKCGIDFGLEPHKMFFCPSYSREGIIKRWLSIVSAGHA